MYTHIYMQIYVYMCMRSLRNPPPRVTPKGWGSDFKGPPHTPLVGVGAWR